MPDTHICCWHMEICPVCGERKSVTEPRDFGYPKYKHVMEDSDGADEVIRDAKERDERPLGSSNRPEGKPPEGAETLVRRVERAKRKTDREPSRSRETEKPFRRYRAGSAGEVDSLEVDRSFAEGVLMGLQRAKEQVDDAPPQFLAASIFFGGQLELMADFVQEVLNQTEEGDKVVLFDYGENA